MKSRTCVRSWRHSGNSSSSREPERRTALAARRTNCGEHETRKVQIARSPNDAEPSRRNRAPAVCQDHVLSTTRCLSDQVLWTTTRLLSDVSVLRVSGNAPFVQSDLGVSRCLCLAPFVQKRPSCLALFVSNAVRPFLS